MSTNWILVFLLVILATCSVFLPEILGTGEFGIGAELPDEPSVWDILTFNASFIWSAMTFTIPDMPWWMGTIFWVMSFLWIYCVIRLVRGTS